MRQWQRIWLFSAVALSLTPAFVQASRLDDLVAALGADNDQARSLARQLLPREGVQAVPRLLPLLRQEKAAVREAAFQVLADIANEASAPGRAADRTAVTAHLMTLLETGQPADIKIRGLRLLPIVIPPDGEVGPVAALLSDKVLRERAREALEQTGNSASRTALREQLAQADLEPEFACALLNSLGRLHDRESLGLIARLAQDGNAKVRAAAARALAWTGDPSHLKSVQSVAAVADPATRPDALDALLRLLNSMERRRAHQHEALAGYRELVASAQGSVKDGALAGLSRVGDSSCVPVILAAIRDAAPPTLLVGMDALRALPGDDVTRGLVAAYPELSSQAQPALVPALGARRDPVALPLLEQLARSNRGEIRVAALEAIGEFDQPQAIGFLSAQAERGDEAQRAKIHDIIARHKLREIENRQRGLAAGAHDTDLQGLLGIIGRWWVVGPFDLGDKNQGWQTSYVGEPNVNVVARYMAGKTRRQWKRVESQDSQGKVDLRATIADRDNCIGYAYAEIELEKPVEAVLLLGVDDSERIWVNGNQVFEQFTARPLQVDQDRVPVHLKAGTNTVLLKLYQNTQGWEFCVRIVTTDGQPVPFKQRSE